jgi:hypothetical protein
MFAIFMHLRLREHVARSQRRIERELVDSVHLKFSSNAVLKVEVSFPSTM